MSLIIFICGNYYDYYQSIMIWIFRNVNYKLWGFLSPSNAPSGCVYDYVTYSQTLRTR